MKNNLTLFAFAFLFVIAALYSIAPPSHAATGVWTPGMGSDPDITQVDTWCPITAPNTSNYMSIFTDVPYCDAGEEEGAACNTSTQKKCKTDFVSNGSYCTLRIAVLRCVAPGCTLTKTSDGSCTKTGDAWTTSANIQYTGAQERTWTSTSGACLSTCQASGAKFCSQQLYQYDLLSKRTWTCWSSSGDGSYQSAPQQQTDINGEPDTRTTTTMATLQPVYSCTAPTYASTCDAPTATISANPVSIATGSSSTLSYSCTNSASASIDQGIGPVNATQPSTKVVSPTSSTKYTLTCTSPSGATATAAATIAVTAPTLGASCSVSPATIATGGTARWTAKASGGSGTYAYSWRGTDGLEGKTTNPVDVTYSTPGNKTGTVTVYSGGLTKTVACSNSLSVTSAGQSDLTVDLPESISVALGQTVTLTGTISNKGPVSTGVPFPAMFRIWPSGEQERLLKLFSGSTARGIPNGFPGVSPQYPSGYSEDFSTTFTPTEAKTYQYGYCADEDDTWHGTVTESNEDNNCSGYGTITVTANKPDLTASNTTASNVSGLTATVTTTITNQGDAGTYANFTDLFQYATDGAGSNAKSLGTVNNSPRAPGTSNDAHIAATFPSAGTWYVRACADKNAAGDPGVIAESDETNNCSPNWTAVTVSNTLSCSVNDTTPDVGDTVTYTATGGARPYTWTNGEGNVLGATGSTATRTFRTADAGKSFSMKVDSSGFATGNCPVVTVNGGAQVCTNPKVDISADPTRVQQGDTSNLKYSASGVNGPCTITGTNGDTWTKAAGSCSVATTTQATSALTTQTTYTLDCNGTKDTVIINVVPTVIET